MFGRRKQQDNQSPLQRRNIKADGQRAPVFSYYSNRSNPEAPRAPRASQSKADTRRKSTPWWVGYMPSLVALGFVLVAGLYLTTLSTDARIQLTAGGNQPAVVQETSVYEKAAQEELERSLFSRSKLTINTDSIARALRARFPELGDVVVAVPLISRKPIITIQPSTPALILSGQGGTYVIDTNGKPVLKASSLISSVKDSLPVVSDDSGTAMELGQQLLTTDLVSFIGKVDLYLKAKKVPVENYSLPALANELHVRMQGQGYYVKFNTESDVRVQVGTYLALSEKLQTDGTVPTEYMDVRVEERAYFK
jgi:hypothetical protein